MLHTEEMGKYLYEVRHDDKGNSTHALIKGEDTHVFPTAEAAFRFAFTGYDGDYFHCTRSTLADIYEQAGDAYDYDSIKEIAFRPSPDWKRRAINELVEVKLRCLGRISNLRDSWGFHNKTTNAAIEGITQCINEIDKQIESLELK
jgi:hypothetical protein